MDLCLKGDRQRGGVDGAISEPSVAQWLTAAIQSYWRITAIRVPYSAGGGVFRSQQASANPN